MGFGPALQGEFPSGSANLVKGLQSGGHTALERSYRACLLNGHVVSVFFAWPRFLYYFSLHHDYQLFMEFSSFSGGLGLSSHSVVFKVC